MVYTGEGKAVEIIDEEEFVVIRQVLEEIGAPADIDPLHEKFKPWIAKELGDDELKYEDLRMKIETCEYEEANSIVKSKSKKFLISVLSRICKFHLLAKIQEKRFQKWNRIMKIEEERKETDLLVYKQLINHLFFAETDFSKMTTSFDEIHSLLESFGLKRRLSFESLSSGRTIFRYWTVLGIFEFKEEQETAIPSKSKMLIEEKEANTEEKEATTKELVAIATEIQVEKAEISASVEQAAAVDLKDDSSKKLGHGKQELVITQEIVRSVPKISVSDTLKATVRRILMQQYENVHFSLSSEFPHERNKIIEDFAAVYSHYWDAYKEARILWKKEPYDTAFQIRDLIEKQFQDAKSLFISLEKHVSESILQICPHEVVQNVIRCALVRRFTKEGNNRVFEITKKLTLTLKEHSVPQPAESSGVLVQFVQELIRLSWIFALYSEDLSLSWNCTIDENIHQSCDKDSKEEPLALWPAVTFKKQTLAPRYIWKGKLKEDRKGNVCSFKTEYDLLITMGFEKLYSIEKNTKIPNGLICKEFKKSLDGDHEYLSWPIISIFVNGGEDACLQIKHPTNPRLLKKSSVKADKICKNCSKIQVKLECRENSFQVSVTGILGVSEAVVKSWPESLKDEVKSQS